MNTDLCCDKSSNKNVTTKQTQISSLSPSEVQYFRRKLPDTCISFGSPEGKVIFREALCSGYMEIYFRLASQLRTQDEPAFCGLAALVMTLNALEVDPGRVWKRPWRWYHEDMLDCCVPLDIIKQDGITLDHFVCLALCNGLQTSLTRVDKSADYDKFKRLVETTCQQDDQVLVLSYSRKALNQTGDGHFAPVGGYHPDRELVLLFDTARFKYPSHWVPLKDIWKAMNYIDLSTGCERGYVILSKSNFSTCLLLYKATEWGSQLFLHGPSDSRSATIAELTKLKCFLDAWNEWLNTILDENLSIEIAVSRLLDLLWIHQPKRFLIGCQTPFSQADKTLSTILNEIIDQINNSSVGQVVRRLLLTHKTLLLDAQPKTILNCFEIPDNLSPVVSSAINSDKLMYPVLIITGFILSFPYATKSDTKSEAVKKLVSNVSQKLSENTIVEVNQLSFQLSSLRDHIDKHCSYCPKI